MREKAERGAAELLERGRVRLDDHAVLDARGARAGRVRVAGDLDLAQAA